MPLSEVYYLYGAILVEQQEFEAAKGALKKALRWNPMSCRNSFEYAEIFKMTDDYEEFYKLTVDIFKISFNKKDIARCYRNLGFYFIEKNQYDEAAACYFMSTSFEPDSKQAMSELYYISTKTGKNLVEPSLREVQRYAEEYGFPIGADEDVVGLSYAYGKNSFENGELDYASYFWRITYELTDDEEVGAKLKVVEESLN
jgi:tetratricopeptide (TPR) repeat protein